MSVLVVGDVHGCAEELGELLRAASPAAVVLVGDLFTKGPDPVGVWGLIREHGARAVLGNHDDHLLNLRDRPGETGAHRCLAALDAGAPGWEPWVRALPLFLDVAGFTVVHAGLHPSGDRAQTTRDMALTMRRWPDEGGPFWWQVYEGEGGVIFGHDAKRGHVRVDRDGAQWLVGLDTGCVYGGQLTGFFPETGEVVQVQAKRAYKAI